MMEKTKRKDLSMKKYFIVLFLLVASVSFLGGYIVDPSEQQADIYVAGSKLFEVKQGESVSEIAMHLQEDNIIESRISFMTYAAITGSFKTLKPGIYNLAENGSIPSIIRSLIKGPKDITVVLTPGMTVAEMDKLLSDKGIIEKGSLTKLSVNGSLEGFLMPDTYKFKPSSNTREVVDRLRKNFDEKTSDLFKNIRQVDIPRIITIASLVEKEVSSLEDKKIVSGIIYKRLYDNHPLQIDASVAYGVCDGIFSGCKDFGFSSLKKDSPYNTYTRTGLPPRPISNPSLDSIRAALEPTQTDYYFYMTDRSTGETLFSKTFEEHTQKRELYLR